MIKTLDETVLDSLLDAGADDKVIDLVLAALVSEAAVDAVLADQPAAARPDPSAERISPRGAFLTRLVVRGFRGVGHETTLDLPAGPGLTVIAGRNGSGKSSLSEALECALTGTTARWERKLGHADFRTGWRNLHQPDPCEIALTLDQADQGQATIRVAWPKGADDPKLAVTTYQVAGQKREQLDLGWQAALQSYRPLLSYDDLGQLLTAKPSELHDSIARALALDELAAAVELLGARIAPLKAPLKRAGADRAALRKELAVVDDHRAVGAAKVLSKATPDLAALAGLIAGSNSSTRPAQVCEQITALTLPSPAEVEAAAVELTAATDELVGIGDRRARSEELRDQLLTEALTYHGEVGDAVCPVCATGTLDADWVRRTQQALAATDLFRRARSDAEQRLRKAEQAARQLITPSPAVLESTEVDLPGRTAVDVAWARWSAVPEPPTADHLRAEHGPLVTAFLRWQQEARDHERTIADLWAPYALRLSQLLTDFEKARDLDRQAERLDAAFEAGIRTAARLRAERLTPIVNQTKRIWAQLKQDSNVSIAEIELTGKANRRAVDIKAVVDKAPGHSALSVMSQGELNSLALALYLPRATSEASPFRFLVLDDPVQAMDPTKVDGLAAVLGELARTRQVIVFSHDDRLAQAARRLPTPPTVLSVRRGHHSEVIVQSDLRPARRHLDDAYAILGEANMAEAVKRRILPGVLRHAVEAAAWQRYSTERLHAGDRLDELERHWEKADRTRARLELLLGSRAQADAWLARDARRDRTVRVCNAGTHQPTTARLDEAYADTKAMVDAIEAKLS